MRCLVLSSLLLAAGLTSFATGGGATPGPITGIVTSDFGTPAGLGEPPILKLEWDATNHALAVKITTASGTGAPLTAHYLAYGQALLQPPFPLPGPFWVPGSVLYPLPIDVLGAFNGDASTVAVPKDPALVGQVFYLQALPEYAVAAPFPVYGATQGVKLQFQ
jgi:hypothetical protein